jgi:hypothetical protein
MVDRHVEPQLKYGGRMYAGYFPMMLSKALSSCVISEVIPETESVSRLAWLQLQHNVC